MHEYDHDFRAHVDDLRHVCHNMELYVVIRTDPWLTVVEEIAPSTIDRIEQACTRCAMAEDNPMVRYHAVRYSYPTHQHRMKLPRVRLA